MQCREIAEAGLLKHFSEARPNFINIGILLRGFY